MGAQCKEYLSAWKGDLQLNQFGEGRQIPFPQQKASFVHLFYEIHHINIQYLLPMSIHLKGITVNLILIV